MRHCLFLALVACGPDKTSDTTVPTVGSTGAATGTATGTAPGTAGGTPGGTAVGTPITTDLDQDGVTAAAGDCDDTNNQVYPGAPEICGNGLDDGCTGVEGGCGWTGAATLAGRALTGHEAGAQAGHVLALCDTSGDGLDDVVIGAWGSAPAGAGSGGVFVFEGPVTGDAATDQADWTVAGAAVDQQAGYGLACGDGDGDGFADLLVGGPTAAGQGAAYLIRGGPGAATSVTGAVASWTGEYAQDRVGGSVVAFDDDGDGDPSFAATNLSGTTGTATANGVAYVFAGDATGTVTADLAQAQIYGQPTDNVLNGVGSAGDLDGDGNEDLLVAGYRNPGQTYHSVFVFRGPVTGTMYKGSADAQIDDGDSLTGLGAEGRAMTHADLDGDGHDDLLLGNPTRGGDTGSVYLWFGNLVGDSSVVLADAKLLGELAGERFGASVASPGDLDGDGNAELVVGSASSDRISVDGGGVALFYGPFAGTLQGTDAAARWDAADGPAAAGWVLAAGNADGDAAPDLAIGAPNSANGADNGRVWLLDAWNL